MKITHVFDVGVVVGSDASKQLKNNLVIGALDSQI